MDTKFATDLLIMLLVSDHQLYRQEESLLLQIIKHKKTDIKEIYTEVICNYSSKTYDKIKEKKSLVKQLYRVAMNMPDFLFSFMGENPTFSSFYQRLIQYVSINSWEDAYDVEKFCSFLNFYSVSLNLEEIGQGHYVAYGGQNDYEQLLLPLNIEQNNQFAHFSNNHVHQLFFLEEDDVKKIQYTDYDSLNERRETYDMYDDQKGNFVYIYQNYDVSENSILEIALVDNKWDKPQLVFYVQTMNWNMTVQKRCGENIQVDFQANHLVANQYCTKQKQLVLLYQVLHQEISDTLPIYNIIDLFLPSFSKIKTYTKNQKMN